MLFRAAARFIRLKLIWQFIIATILSRFLLLRCAQAFVVGISNQQTLLDSILKNAQTAMGRDDLPAAVLVFSSRFGRVFQKYESLGYRLILIELGAIFQTLYLLAAELNLSVCGLGAGNSTEFSACLNLDYFKETSIGEFVINGMF